MQYASIIKNFAVISASALLGLSAAHATSNLVSVEWLKENIGKPDVIVLDASPTQFYAAKHIPGAHSVSFAPEQSVSQNVRVSYGGGVDLFTDSVNIPYPFQERPTADMQKLFQDWGVSKNSTVVVYDQGAQFYATRLFYSFFYNGFPVENLHILDGGLSKWEASGSDVTKDVPAIPAKGNFAITEVRDAFQADVTEMVAASGDREKNALVEALGPDWHFGIVNNYNRPGHIPYAKMVPSAVFFNEDKTFKSAEDIRNLLAFNNVREDQTIYTHCGGGIAGSVPFFATKFIAGYENVKHFPDSQLGWLNDDRELPFWTYDAPYVVRETDWLKWWGGLRTRTLGSIHVSIIDIRDSDAYNTRHVPFALNVPATKFRDQQNASDLAKTLGSAGVNPQHEAVIFSGEGITPNAALAFVTLENLGQKNVSIFTDTLDTWANRGNTLSDKPTIVAEKAIPFDLAIPPVDYVAEAREDVLVSELGAADSPFPRVFLASGNTLPANAPEGAPVVHVPYTQLLDENGKPKSASEIWQILAKAGLPRFAEIVTVSDDVGEAAANYVILKLMGYPSIQVLAS